MNLSPSLTKSIKGKIPSKKEFNSNINTKNFKKIPIITNYQKAKRLKNTKSFSKFSSSSSSKPITQSELFIRTKSISPDIISIDNNDKSLSLYKAINEEQTKIISHLRTTLYKEQENKISLQNEVTKLRQKSLNAPHLNNTTNKCTLQKKVECNDNTIAQLSFKLNKLVEMIINFSLAMNSLRELLRRKNVDVIDIKNEYKNLSNKLIDLMKDSMKNRQIIDRFKEDNKNEFECNYIPQSLNLVNNISIIEKRNNEYPLMQINQINKDIFNNSIDNTLMISETSVNMGSFIKDTSHFGDQNDNSFVKNFQETLEDNNNNNNINNNIISNSNSNRNENIDNFNNNNNNKENININKNQDKIFTFRDDDIKLPQKDYESPDQMSLRKLIQENKNLKSELASKILTTTNSKDEIEKIRNELINAQIKINELSSINSTYTNSIPSNNSNETLLKNEISELTAKFQKDLQQTKNAIELKEKEITELKEINSTLENNLFIKLKENYKNNIVNIKQTFESLFNDKNKKIEELSGELLLLNDEINNTKIKLSSIQNENRIQNIIKEATLSDLENKKTSLEIALESLKSELLNAEMNHLSENDTKQNEINEDLMQKNKKLASTINLLNKQVKDLNDLITSKDVLITAIKEKSKESSSQIEIQVNEYINTINKLKEEINSKEVDSKMKEKEINELNLKNKENTMNYQNKLNELNEIIIQLKAKISMLLEEKENYLKNEDNIKKEEKREKEKEKEEKKEKEKENSYRIETNKLEYIITSNIKDNEIKKLQKEILELKTQMSSNDENSITNRTEKHNYNNQTHLEQAIMSRQSTEKELSCSNRQINKQKEELIVLKAKLRSTLDENKSFSIKVNEMEDEYRKEKEEYINVLRSAFHKFISETMLNSKNREFSTIVLKLLNYTDADIQDIYNTIGKKKGNGMFGFFKK